eukprot:6213868-Pleurochrysis_carterae.AAC.1
MLVLADGGRPEGYSVCAVLECCGGSSCDRGCRGDCGGRDRACRGRRDCGRGCRDAAVMMMVMKASWWEWWGGRERGQRHTVRLFWGWN